MFPSSGADVSRIVAVLGAGAVLAFAAAQITRKRPDRGWLSSGIIAVLTCAFALYLVLGEGSADGQGAVWQYMALDGLGRYISVLVLSLCAVASVYSVRYMRDLDAAGRFYGLLLLMSAGVIGVAASKDTIGLYLYFELMSVSSYSLVSFRKDRWAPVEAGLKYAIMNATGSGLALLGICLAYLYTGSTSLGSIGWVLRGSGSFRGPEGIALALTVTGLGVKSAMVPFHTWVPDAYSSAPAGAAAVLAGIVTEMGPIAMIRLVLGEYTSGSMVFGIVLMIMGTVTMTVGNLGALGQRDIKRMLAYSSIAQVGYVMVGLGLGFGLGIADGVKGALFHLLTHGAMKSAAFLSVGVLTDHAKTRDIDKMRGFGRKHPLESATLGMACLSLAGIPGFAGFMSKWWIYRAGLESGSIMGVACGVLAILNSVISLGYYLPVVWKLFASRSSEQEQSVDAAPRILMGDSWGILPVAALGVAIMFLGLYPVPVLRAIESAAKAAMSMIGGS